MDVEKSDSETAERARLRQKALSRWENEGGSLSPPLDSRIELPPLTNAELVQLRVRVIAIENVVIALLARVSDGDLELVREMAAFITPRAGSTQHHLTVQAASEMIGLLQRAVQCRAPD
jgi:hypothetical protein